MEVRIQGSMLVCLEFLDEKGSFENFVQRAQQARNGAILTTCSGSTIKADFRAVSSETLGLSLNTFWLVLVGLSLDILQIF